jgi:hypothetical protein
MSLFNPSNIPCRNAVDAAQVKTFSRIGRDWQIAATGQYWNAFGFLGFGCRFR